VRQQVPPAEGFTDFLGRLTIVLSLAALASVCTWYGGPIVTRWHRQQLAEKLATQIDDFDDTRVKIPLRQIARCGPPALGVLVRLAGAERAAVAVTARQIVAERLANWRMQAAENERFAIGGRTTQLAELLADHIDRFGPQGKHWAEGIALDMIELSDDLPPPDAARLLDKCGEILAAIPPRGRRLRTVGSGSVGLRDPTPPPRIPRIPLDIFAVPSEQAIKADPSTPPETLEGLHGQRGAGATSAPATSVSTPGAPAAPKSAWLPKWKSLPRDTPPHAARAPLPLPAEQPTTGTPPVEPQVIDVPSPSEMENRIAKLQNVAPDILLRRLPRVDFYEAGAIRKVLRQQGYDDNELTLVRRLSSAETSERLRGLEDLSVLPAGRARRWLHVLLTDASAEVRFRALSAMATTDDPQLFELAQDVALGDRDSRVAELATRVMQQAR